MLFHRRFLVVVIATTVCWISDPCSPGNAQEPDNVLPRITESTFDERNADDFRNHPPEEDVLVIPFPPFNNLAPFHNPEGTVAPLFTARWNPPMRTNEWMWEYLPWSEDTEAYLTEREASLTKIEESETQREKEQERMHLVRWCADHDLPALAAYEAAQFTVGRSDFRSASFRRFHEYYLQYMDTQHTPFSLPLPVEGEWYVVVDRTGHHRIKPGAAYAFDIVIHRNGSNHSGQGSRLEDYYAFDQPVIAQGDGVVIAADSHFRDLPAGQGGRFDEANMVLIDYGYGVQALYGHLKRGSVTVEVGDRVEAGQELGRVGNSGASGRPHLHFCMVHAGGMAIPGRFFFQSRSRQAGRWLDVEGENLTEGTYVRSMD